MGSVGKNHESGKRAKGVIEDSSLQLRAPEIAVNNHKVAISLELGEPTISEEIEGTSRT